jgi:hypothetical protein
MLKSIKKIHTYRQTDVYTYMHNKLSVWNNPSNANCCSPTQEVLRYSMFISFRECSNPDELNPQRPFLLLRNILITFSHIVLDLQVVFGSKFNTKASRLPWLPHLWPHHPSVLRYFLLPSLAKTISRFSSQVEYVRLESVGSPFPLTAVDVTFSNLYILQNDRRTITVAVRYVQASLDIFNVNRLPNYFTIKIPMHRAHYIKLKYAHKFR